MNFKGYLKLSPLSHEISGLGVVGFIFTAAALPFVDTVGRRRLLLIGLIGMSISLACLSFAFHQGASSPAAKWVALGSIVFYLMNFAFSMGPLVWVFIAEIFPTSVRGLACGVSTGVHWFADMAVAFSFLPVVSILGPTYTFFLFFILNVCCLAFVYYKVPETKQISLEAIEIKFNQSK